MQYKPFGAMTGLDTASGASINNDYGDCGCGAETTNPGTSMEMIYTHDKNRNLKSIVVTNQPWMNKTYDYDERQRLVGATGLFGSTEYTYDLVGNRLTKSITKNSIVTDDGSSSYIPGTNKIAEITSELVSNGYWLTRAYEYDENGNPTSIILPFKPRPTVSQVSSLSRTFIYNQSNRLVRVENDGNYLGEYTYNGRGQRVTKQVYSKNTVFLYDFDGNLMAEADIDGTLEKEYIFFGNSPFAMIDSPSDAFYYYGNDKLGTPQILTDETQTSVWEAYYKPFGEADVSVFSTVTNNLRFPGQYFDEETGFHYNWHRYYDPSTGRYLTPDPIGLSGGINLYGYVQNDPVNYIDPYGLWAFSDMPSFSDAFPDSNYIAPIADVAAGGIELGVGVAFGTAGAIGLIAGPEFWPIAAPALATGVAAGWDGQGRLRTGLERLGDNTPPDPCE